MNLFTSLFALTSRVRHAVCQSKASEKSWGFFDHTKSKCRVDQAQRIHRSKHRLSSTYQWLVDPALRALIHPTAIYSVHAPIRELLTAELANKTRRAEMHTIFNQVSAGLSSALRSARYALRPNTGAALQGISEGVGITLRRYASLGRLSVTPNRLANFSPALSKK